MDELNSKFLKLEIDRYHILDNYIKGIVKIAEVNEFGKKLFM